MRPDLRDGSAQRPLGHHGPLVPAPPRADRGPALDPVRPPDVGAEGPGQGDQRLVRAGPGQVHGGGHGHEVEGHQLRHRGDSEDLHLGHAGLDWHRLPHGDARHHRPRGELHRADLHPRHRRGGVPEALDHILQAHDGEPGGHGPVRHRRGGVRNGARGCPPLLPLRVRGRGDLLRQAEGDPAAHPPAAGVRLLLALHPPLAVLRAQLREARRRQLRLQGHLRPPQHGHVQSHQLPGERLHPAVPGADLGDAVGVTRRAAHGAPAAK
mmetsp:Transcript_69207/g.149274  ORF Transcript_69207/g.149274 Transcript_69207/m.149274 type:complete len:267 (-) Transcript_69207:25-825(-)